MEKLRRPANTPEPLRRPRMDKALDEALAAAATVPATLTPEAEAHLLATMPPRAQRQRYKKLVKELEARIVEQDIEIKILRRHLADLNQRHSVGSVLDSLYLATPAGRA